MRNNREYDETEVQEQYLTAEERDSLFAFLKGETGLVRDDCGEIDSVDEGSIMSSSDDRKERHECDAEELVISPTERNLLLDETHKDLLTNEEREGLVKECFNQVNSKNIDSIAHEESEKLPIDADEVHRLYFDELWNMKEIAKQYGYKTSCVILRIFKENGWKSRSKSTLEIEVNPEEVHRLYFKEGFGLKEVAVKLGYKSQSPIRRIFKEQAWETRKKWRNLDYDKIHELYYEQKLPLEKVAKEMGLTNHYPIVCIFEEQGWKARSPHGCRVEINPEEVWRLYYKEKMTMGKIAEHFGYKGCSAISRIFREQGWINRRSETVDKDIDSEQVREMYFEKGLSLLEVGRRLGKTGYALKKLFHRMEWSKRKIKHDTEEERKISQKDASNRYFQELRTLHDNMFGSECVICGNEREIIHRKDGTKHSRNVLWSKKSLESLDVEEWAAVCKPCHLSVHHLMKVKIFGWQDIVSILKDGHWLPR